MAERTDLARLKLICSDSALSRAIAQLRAPGVANWSGREVLVTDVSELMEVAGCTESTSMWTRAAA